MSLPFAKGKAQHEDEQAVSTEVQGRKQVKRWWGIEIGFKVRICKTTRNVRPQPPLRNAEMAVAFDPPLSTDTEETTVKTYSIYCLTPPTDPPTDPPK
ncbi:MAG TPA: hypothetical protein VGR07_19165 [Thermoanaerobaculia bacterium]|nr:hypothetical protein [Thermoanaerobaculia bacterium]